MKKIFAICLAAAMLAGLWGCSSGEAPAETAAPPSAETASTAAETEAPCTEPAPDSTERQIYLTVSEITFSLVGESEDIYIGLAPREQVIWTSSDETVVTADSGILYAVGVGTATVTASVGEEALSVKVSCLAATREALEALDEEILRSPKRMPPAVDAPPLEFFDDAAIIGDSISYILFQYETQLGHLGNPLFLARGGTSLNGLVMYYKNVYFRGVETKIEDAVGESGVSKVFVSLGQNDLGYRTIEDTMSSWDLLISRMREQNPDLEIYIQSCFPEWQESYKPNEKNEKIALYNQELIRYCQDNGYRYVDVAQYVVDHTDRLATCYSMDYGIHLNEPGCVVWMQALNAYAQQLLLGGTGL